MSVRWNTEMVQKEMNKEGYKLLSEYKRNNIKLKIMCDKGHVYETIWSNYQKGCRCPYCYGRIITIDDIRKELSEDGTVLISTEYINAHKHLEVKCPKCNQEYSATWNNLKKGKRCPYCCHNHTIDINYVRGFASEKGYKVLSTEYENAYKELTFECPNGHVFDLVWCYFQKGTECPCCKTSKGESKIAELLTEHDIEFKRELCFDDCKYKGNLRFDFYLPKHNLIIEYDGKQHFEPIDFSGKGEEWAMEQYLETIERDNLKNQYCENNNINMFRIPFWEFKNIENILSKELSLF